MFRFKVLFLVAFCFLSPRVFEKWAFALEENSGQLTVKCEYSDKHLDESSYYERGLIVEVLDPAGKPVAEADVHVAVLTGPIRLGLGTKLDPSMESSGKTSLAGLAVFPLRTLEAEEDIHPFSLSVAVSTKSNLLATTKVTGTALSANIPETAGP